jgi:malonyl CoA-acyl carrier protein transacylase
VVTSLNVTVTLASQASVAVGGAKAGVAGQSIGVVCVTHVMVGGVISCTTIVRLHAELLPQSSVAVHVRVVL